MKHIGSTLLTLLACILPATLPARDVTFLSTSDSHYREPDHRAGNHNDLNRASIEEMNRIMDLTWPEKLGGGKIAKPRGLVMLGDLIDDGDRAENGRKISEEQYELFKADVGLDGTDGLLKYPVFEGWGNHDGPPIGKEKHGFSSRAQIKERNRIRMDKQLISIVINITGDRLRAAYRMKAGVRFEKGPDGRQQHMWGGAWEWKWLLDKYIASQATNLNNNG